MSDEKNPKSRLTIPDVLVVLGYALLLVGLYLALGPGGPTCLVGGTLTYVGLGMNRSET